LSVGTSAIFGGKPAIRGMRVAVEHVLGMLAAGDAPERLLDVSPKSAFFDEFLGPLNGPVLWGKKGERGCGREDFQRIPAGTAAPFL
jgi:hypothetical protein